MRRALGSCSVGAALVVAACAPSPFPSSELYRLDDNLDRAIEIEAADPPTADSLLSWEFETGEPPGWSAEGDSSCRVSDGVLVVQTDGPDVILSPPDLEIDPEVADSIVLQVRVEGTNALDFRPIRDPNLAILELKNLQHIPVVRQGEWSTYRIRGLRFLGHAKGTRTDRATRIIRRLALHVSEPARVEIDWIRVAPSLVSFLGRRAGVTEQLIDFQARQCLFVHSPGEITYRLEVPSGAFFSCGLGVPDGGRPVTFKGLIRGEGEGEELFSNTVGEGGRWKDLKIDLGRYGGRTVSLALRTECDAPGEVGLWSNPVLYQARSDGERRASGVRRAIRQRRLNVVVYVIDALRADHLSAYGYQRELAPNMRALAERGTRFAWAFSNDTWTRASVATLFTGVPVFVHGVRNLQFGLPRSLTLLAEVLRSEGVPTHLLTENGHLNLAAHFGRGFSFTDQQFLRPGSVLGSRTLEQAVRFIDSHRDRRFFLYVHTMEPHAPYRPEPHYYGLFLPPGEEPPPILRERPDRIDPEEFGSRDFYKYDGEIIRADDNLQRFVSKLKTLGVYDDTLLIVTADHGEAFAEHEDDYGHGGKPYNPVTHIPLIVHLPGVVPAGRVIDDPVQILDLAPTVLDLFGLPVPDQLQGRSLVPVLTGPDAELESRTIFSYARGVTAAVRGRWKLIHDPEAGKDRLYDLRTDPGETTDLAADRPSIAAELVAEIASYLERQERLGAEVQAREEATVVQWSVGELEALRAIGYVE